MAQLHGSLASLSAVIIYVTMIILAVFINPERYKKKKAEIRALYMFAWMVGLTAITILIRG